MSEQSPPELPVRLLLVRHGEVAANRELRYVGSRDEPLTENGEEQARRLALYLEALPISRVLSSPRRRAQATALEIARVSGQAVETDERLAEQCFGDWEGLGRADIKALGPEHQELLRRFDREPSVSPPNGEPFIAVRDRVTSLLAELATEHGRTITLVSHVGPIKSLLASALGIDLSVARRFFLDPATLTVIDWGPTPLLRLFNAVPGGDLRDSRWATTAVGKLAGFLSASEPLPPKNKHNDSRE